MKHTKTIEQKVINFIKTHGLLTSGNKILIGFSGGADSVFAILFFVKYAKKYKHELSAIHVNHNLRGSESDDAESFCRQFCKERNIEFISKSVNVKLFAKKNKISIEEAARDLRYAEFFKVLKQKKIDFLVTAHNSDDNAETVLLNIVQGTGLKGIGGIPVKRDNVIRPFLCLSKNEITEYLSTLGIQFIYDSSNSNIEYRRNYLRNEIIPLLKTNINPNLSSNILNSSFAVKNQISTLDYLIGNLISSLIIEKNDFFEIDLKKLNDHPEYLYGEIVKNIFEQKLKMEFSFSQYEKFKSVVEKQVGKSVELGGGWYLIRERNKIIITKEITENKICKKITLGSTLKILNNKIRIELVDSYDKSSASDPNVEFISGDKITSEIYIRNWEKGDKIRPLGMKGTKKISDVLTDLKIPLLKRKDQLVLVWH